MIKPHWNQILSLKRSLLQNQKYIFSHLHLWCLKNSAARRLSTCRSVSWPLVHELTQHTTSYAHGVIEWSGRGLLSHQSPSGIFNTNTVRAVICPRQNKLNTIQSQEINDFTFHQFWSATKLQISRVWNTVNFLLICQLKGHFSREMSFVKSGSHAYYGDYEAKESAII